ncbi:MAG: hypothetical protein R6V44_04745 [Paracoccaceae bacterium]
MSDWGGPSRPSPAPAPAPQGPPPGPGRGGGCLRGLLALVLALAILAAAALWLAGVFDGETRIGSGGTPGSNSDGPSAPER